MVSIPTRSYPSGSYSSAMIIMITNFRIHLYRKASLSNLQRIPLGRYLFGSELDILLSFIQGIWLYPSPISLLKRKGSHAAVLHVAKLLQSKIPTGKGWVCAKRQCNSPSSGENTSPGKSGMRALFLLEDNPLQRTGFINSEHKKVRAGFVQTAVPSLRDDPMHGRGCVFYEMIHTPC